MRASMRAHGRPHESLDGRMNLWMASRGSMRSINGHFPVFPCIAHPNNQKTRKYKAEFTYTHYNHKVQSAMMDDSPKSLPQL